MMLSANSCLAVFVMGISLLSFNTFTLQNDLKQIDYQDSLCILRGYIGYSTCAIVNYSFLLQALFQYMTAVYPHYLFYQSVRSQILLIIIAWIIGFTYPLEFLLRDEIIFNVDNQICQIPMKLSFSIIYMSFCIYIIPILVIMFIYIKLIRYVKKISKRVVSVNILFRAQRELKMIRRTVILVAILGTICAPYQTFIIISLFTEPPRYHFRIAYVFVDLSLLCVIIVLFQFTDPVKTSIMKRIRRLSNMIIPTIS
ncbi:unnamed protein product [Adineta steineri]|uniref:G-protein coupled receptors family 1 profile domain-containing protein n=1 Tax=Adineta steineri TaxID=433720 RepID=A0A819IY04_9BILA|nr:unnamed protein product [Adineta steineri]CAF1243835.1 unnamed protein product [Adineta steineri]CAF1271133.1 unnamed protein product [Adineta steineri]CAF3813952.1 unnamed protein product [Adineta steineri]CAF3925449.1 unnamed protein product [Adineta steineri]